jgi:hypothetical protein
MVKKLKIAILIIIFKQKYLLQLVNNKKNINEVNTWVLFGGHSRKN